MSGIYPTLGLKAKLLAQETKPSALAPNLAGIPAVLKAERRWVCWRFERDDKKRWTKVLYSPETQQRASSTNSSTWTDFPTAWGYFVGTGRGYDGVGFVLGDGWAGIDLDDCRDPATGKLLPWAEYLIQRFDSFADVSPSGTGVKIFVRGKLPVDKGRHVDPVEIYDRGRYFTITGIPANGCPLYVNERTELVGKFYKTLEELEKKAKKETQKAKGKMYIANEELQSPRTELADEEVIDLATRAKNGDKFLRLWAGDASGYGDDRSDADAALLGILKFYTRDRAQLDRLFRQSGLMREKWERGDYRKLTFDFVLSGTGETYKPKRRRTKKAKPAADDLPAGGRVNGTSEEIPADDEPSDQSARPFRPRVDAGIRDLAVITPLALQNLCRSNDPPRLFRHSNLPSRLERDENGMPMVKPMTLDRMRHEMARSSDWFKVVKVGNEFVEVECYPPKEICADALATEDPGFPILHRIVQSPVYTAEGFIHQTPGYRPESQTFLELAKGFTCPPVSKNPTRKETGDAAALWIIDLLGDFPFCGDAEKAHALTAALEPFARDLIDGPMPLHLIEKPAPGTGATLLVDALFYPALGRGVSAMTEGSNEEEWRKRVFAKLRSGPAVVLLDNLRRRLDSAALSSVLTAYPVWEDRVLGISETARSPAVCSWIATGNNPALSSEISRRTVRTRLDAKQDRPWLRTGFRHENLRLWMKENRGQLVHAALTLVRAWDVAGRPTGKKVLGMFESWSQVMGGILEVCGVEGFLGNLEEMYEQSDTEGAAWSAFVGCWFERFGENEKGVAELFPLATGDGLLSLGDGKEHSQTIKLGILLRANRDKVFRIKPTEEGREEIKLRLERGKTVRRAVQWKLSPLR
jgi:hypothetical protein